ncbi:unnamed protein product [Lota lota]
MGHKNVSLTLLLVLSLFWMRLLAHVSNLTLSIEEGLPAKTIVGDISAALSVPNSSGFFISESRDSYVFIDLEINADTGIISTAIVLDRESRDRYEFVAATQTGEVIKVKIEVNDVNDHSPIFTSNSIDLEISELSPPGSRFELEGAKDQDEGEFGIQGYRIAEVEMWGLFQLEYRNGSDNPFKLDLLLTSRLNREARDSYSLTIEAFDGGIPARTGSLHVNVHVLDENDNPPVFNQTEYHASVSEDAPVNSTVCQVQATDRDLGSNGLITYEINRRQSDSGEMFSINESTGVIYINKPLDFETQSFHELIISARDNGAQPEFSSTFVGVKVLNINDNAPTVNILFLSESGEAVVSEGAGIGEYIARILVSDGDADLGDNQKVTVTLQGGEGRFTLKQTDHFLFALCVDGPLDREEQERFELTLRATDEAGPSLSAEVTFDLMVTDVNDCPPLFERDTYTVRLAEDVPPGTSVVQVKARDRDEGPNASVRYSLLGPGGSSPQEDPLLFTIDPTSGLIATVRRLDREREAVVRLLVEAEDGGEQALSSTATVTVVIEDVNDNEPVFQQQLYNVSIPEHSQIGSCFLQIVATDTDGPDFASLQYSLSDGFDRKDLHPLFHINADTGEVCVSQDIDRDAGQTSHDILVKAVDQGGLSAQTYVHIEVEDLNDNAPVFNPEQYATSISSHAPPDTEILTAIATDPDSGRYGRVTYELLPSDLSSLFTLDGDTGTLYLRSTVAHLGTASVKLSLSARDGEGLTSAAPATLTVNVVGSAQAPAVFHRSRYSFSVAEDAPPGTSVGTVTAVRPGSSAEPVTYRISSGDPQGWFSVHPDSGLISTRRPLDHEAQPYALLVLQSSTGFLFSSTQVNITVADVNDHAPVFPAERDALALSRNTPPGTVLFIAHAHDADSGDNGQVRYYLTDPQTGAGEKTLFVIDRVLGMVMLNESLRTSGRRTYGLEILARDEGRPPLSARLTLEVNVDHAAPEEDALAFETLVYQVEIGEGYRKDARVIQVKAHQGTQGAHASNAGTAITYSLEPEPGFPTPPFRVHARSGWLYLYQSLDYETEPGYRFRVVATAGDPVLGKNNDTRSTATASVRVQVLDANDNAPVFGSEVYYFTASEGSAPQGLVGTVQAVDRDAQKNAELTYMLLSDGKYFRINTKTGEIMNWVALDREQHSQHSLKVMVSDHGQPRLNATTTVHVSITDVNDNPPCFTHLPPTKEINVQMWAGLPPGSLVTTMFAKDPDAGENGTVTFSLRTADGLGVFEIDTQSGDIILKAASLQPIETHYTLEVIAKDGGLNSLEEVAIVHVQVGHLHACVCVCHQIARRLSVREDTKPATTVGSAAIADSVRFRYSIAEGDGSIHFGIDPSSGDIYVNQPLDYESATQYFLVVRAQEADPHEPAGLNVSVLVSVLLEDVNDHTPWFPDDLVTLGLREDVAAGTLVFAFHAKDADGSLGNSDLRYSLRYERDSDSDSPSRVSPRCPFAIDPRTGRLTVVAPLDRETTPSLAFTVTAFDQVEGGRAGRRGHRKQASVTAQVFLQDVNDNRPVLVSPDTVRVVEDVEVGGLLHHVVAVDRDLGENGRVSYSIVDGDDQGVFRLEENTGLLYLSSPLDHEVRASHQLIIWAGDGGMPRLSSTQTLTVLVEDVNDHPPVFQQEVYAACVAENRNPGEPVVRLTATDGDSGKNAEVQYSLLPGPGYDLFSIHPQTGQVTTTTQLDREQQQQFTLRVLACDGGSPGLSGTTTVECSVQDENDNPPRFVQSSFQVSLPENLPPGVLHTGQASDPDLGENSTIHYSIDTGEESLGARFTIDALTGAVSSTEVLDREEQGFYTLTIRATDGGPHPLSSTTQLHVHLLDENDNSPSFSRNHYHAAVAEGLPAGTAVLELGASDPDQGPNGEVTYSLEEDGSQGAFAVDGSTGVIRTTRPLDRESRAQYTLRALATDGCAVGPQSSEVTVTVEVEDVNDNAPACARDPVNAWVAATRTWRPDQVLATVTATDLDQGENGTVRYMWSEEEGLFALNEVSGEIRLRRPLRAGFPGRRLHVLVADRGEPALTSTCLVFVHLKGDQDGLLFTKKVYNSTVIENSRAGTFVVQIEAVDQANSGLRIGYSIFSGNEREVFAINGNTGEITVQKPQGLDFEQGRQAQLVVLADSGLETAHSRVAITLKDVNDNAPLFDYAYYRTAVWEGQVHNTYIMQVFASDADSGMNGQIEYSIVSGNQNNAFILDPARGILATKVLLDREITPLYKLVVQATDRGSPALSGTTTIRVQVVDVNDNSPAIPPLRPVVVAENLPAGYVVTQVTANDVDLGSTISYSFVDHGDSASGCFAIDRYSGVITLTQALDYEERTEHVLGVLASDTLHQTTGEVVVTVLDVNDNAPVFDRVSYQVEASEEAPANTLIVTLLATDSDSGVNGKVSYRLLNSPPLSFNIHPDNGSVFTNKRLREIPHSNLIQLLVEARDGGDPARSTITSVDVVVLDSNNHAPVFHQDTYTVSVPEDTLPGTTLLTLSAEDADWAPENTYLDFDIVKGNEERRFFLEVKAVQSGNRPSSIGRLVLCNPLDRETQKNYTLTIRATDRGTPPLNGSTVVMVTVMDVNDNAPLFANVEYHSQVSEDSLAGTSLVQISAHDPDLGVNGLVHYEIISGNGKGHLQLDPNSGILSVNGSLDYEEENKYTLTVRASDGGISEERKVAFAVVFVTVLDENDNAPYFMFPTVNCSVSENLPAFSPVCSVFAIDNDLGAYGQLTYSVLSSCFTDYGSGSPERKEAFAIDSLTGDINTRQTFDYELEREFCMVVEARDKGGKAATLRVVVTVKGVDEFSPVFTQSQYNFQLPEDAKPGQTVGYVMAMDKDSGVDGTVEYSFVNPLPFFSIDKTFGSIFVSGPIYRQRAGHSIEDMVQVIISARSPRPDSRSTTCLVSINISSSAVALIGVPLDVHMASLTVSLLAFLLFLTIFVGLVIRYKTREAVIKKAAANAANLNNDTGSFSRPSDNPQNAISLQELIRTNSALQENYISNPCRHSDSSGRGSAEGETVEDQEIKWINTLPYLKSTGSLHSKGELQNPDGDTIVERVSCHSVEVGPEHLACISAGLSTLLASAESLHHFKEEGGGEGLLRTAIRVRDLDESMRIRGHIPLSETRAPAGSLSSLVCPEDQQHSSYSWDYLLDWGPRFQPLASVFTDIGMLRDEDLRGGVEDMAATDASCLMYPPPLITDVAQPGIRTVPPRKPGRVPSLSRRPSYPKYSYSPLERNTGLTPCAMTPSFSPSLSLLTMRTPNASPVVSETGVGGIRLHSGPHTASLLESEIQV